MTFCISQAGAGSFCVSPASFCVEGVPTFPACNCCSNSIARDFIYLRLDGISPFVGPQDPDCPDWCWNLNDFLFAVPLQLNQCFWSGQFVVPAGCIANDLITVNAGITCDNQSTFFDVNFSWVANVGGAEGITFQWQVNNGGIGATDCINGDPQGPVGPPIEPGLDQLVCDFSAATLQWFWKLGG